MPAARPVPADNIHATLAFIGETGRGDEVVEAVAAAAATGRRLALRLEGAGAFPSSRRARVVWVGLGGDVERLGEIAETVRRGLSAAGFPIEERPFAAHVTIARLKAPGPVAVGDLEPEPVGFEVDAITVYRSHLGRPAPRYEAIQRALLAPP